MKEDKFTNWLMYGMIILVLLSLVIGGYFGFTYFATSVMGNFSSFDLIVIAVVAGIAVFFSPCSFPFIPVYLTKFYEVKGVSKKISPLTLGLFASLGLLTFNVFLGLSIAVLGAGFGASLSISGQDPSLVIRWVRGVVGFFLLFVGFSHLTGRGLNLSFLSPKTSLKKGGNPRGTLYRYGFLYTLIGIGCAGPILAGLSIFAFSTGGFDTAFFAFAVYSFVMVALMMLISVLASLSKTTLLDHLKANTTKIKKITGIVVILIALFLIWSSIFLGSFTKLLFP